MISSCFSEMSYFLVSKHLQIYLKALNTHLLLCSWTNLLNNRTPIEHTLFICSWEKSTIASCQGAQMVLSFFTKFLGVWIDQARQLQTAFALGRYVLPSWSHLCQFPISSRSPSGSVNNEVLFFIVFYIHKTEKENPRTNYFWEP